MVKKKYYLFKIRTDTISYLSVVLLGIMLLITYLLGYLYTFKVIEENMMIVLILFLGYLLLHEIIHSIAYVLYGAKYKKITYGIALELGVLYCLCKQNISKNNILHSLLYPLFFIGIITYVISIIFNLPILMWLSIFNISGCSGDIIMFIFISKLKNIEFSEMDDPISFALYSKDDLSNKKFLGLEYIDKKDELERKDFTKIKVSKPSYFILIGLVLLAIIYSKL